jgi:hypothetical protein
MSAERRRAELVALRERHVQTYLGHLTTLTGHLTREAFSDAWTMHGLSRDLMEHVNEMERRLAPLRTTLLTVASEAAGQETDTLNRFAYSLADETIEAILSQIRIDTHRARRLGVELGMAVLRPVPKNAVQRKVAVAHFLADNLYRLDSRGRHLKSERYVRATLNTALFRAHNESLVSANPDRTFRLNRAGHEDVLFRLENYAEVVSTLHPFAEPIVLVDFSVTPDI